MIRLAWPKLGGYDLLTIIGYVPLPRIGFLCTGTTLNKGKEKVAEFDRRIGARLRSLRRMAGFSPIEFARLVGCSPLQVERYETGRDRLSAGRLFEIARALGVAVEDLFAEFNQERAADATAASDGLRPAAASDLRVRAVNETHLQALLSLACAHVTIH